MSGYLMGLGQRDASVLRRFEEFCALEGLAFDRALDDGHVIEAFLALSCRDLAPHSLGTYRSTLRRRGGGLTSRRFPASPAPPPYDDIDLAGLWSRANHQPSRARIANATVLLATMVGAGLRPRELAHLRGCDVVRTSERVALHVSGPSSRLVPLEGPWGNVLVALVDERRDYLFRPGATVRDTKNLVGEIAGSLVGDPDDVTLSSGRCRSTFLCAHLDARTPLRELCALAGLGDVESLLRYARHVNAAPHSKAALRARAARQR